MDNRKIIHIDMDAFYASVEQRTAWNNCTGISEKQVNSFAIL